MIKIICDTTSCIAPEEAAKLGIGYIPQIIVFGDESYRDDTEMNATAFLKRLRASSALPKTAAPPPALYYPLYREYFAAGDSVLVICPSADLSGTFRSATVAAQDIAPEFPNADLHIIDSRCVAGGLGALVKLALRLVAEGKDIATVQAEVEKLAKRERIYFMVDTLEYLYKGGRIGAAKALMGSILQMKPLLLFKDGVINPFDNQRTHRRAIARLKEVVLQDCPHGPEAHLSVLHGDAEAEAREIAAELGNLLGIPVDQIPINDLPPAILVHAGPGVIGVSYFLMED